MSELAVLEGFVSVRAALKAGSRPIDAIIVETNDPEGPFGAKGVGEPGLVPVAPAIANAIYDAVGIRLRRLPMTPDRVLEALWAKAGKAVA